MYLQIFRPMRWLRICAYIGALVTTAFYGAMVVALLVLATPGRGETWTSHFLKPKMGRTKLLPVPTSSVGLLIDLAILVLPIAAVMQLQLPKRRKIGVTLIFMTGSLSAYALPLANRTILTTTELASSQC